ncbi:MAG: TfoX/Sxy family protein [bacterium]|nr:TfoX/Sxy family protein [bacterium]
MAFPKASKALADHLENALSGFSVKKKPMFGAPVFWVNENMFAGVFGDNIFVRLSASQKEELFSQFDEAGPFEPMPGRPMKDYAVLPEEVLNNPESFREWLTKSHQHTSTLPVKVKKKKRIYQNYRSFIIAIMVTQEPA